MSEVGDTFAVSPATKRLAVRRFNIIALAALTVVAVFWQMRWGTITDTSWLITVCERLLDGERLYVDVIETNPPFSVLLYMPAVALARALGMSPEIVVHAQTYLAALAGLCFAGWMVRRAAFEEADRLFVMAPAIYVLLVLFPGNAFSQREHIAVALFLPMVVLMAWRMRGGQTPPLPVAIAAGTSGSVMLLVKPYYALMVLLPVLFTCWRQRSLRPLLAPEHWVIGAICSAYLAMVLSVYPEYVRDIYPRLAEAYVTSRIYEPMLWKYGPTALLLGLSLYLYAPRGRMRELTCTTLLASSAGVMALVWQAKGWPYHAYPALFLAILAAICELSSRQSSLHEAPETAGRTGWPFRTLRIAVLSLGVLTGFMPFWMTQKSSAARVEAVRSAGERPSIASISLDMAVGHPLSRMAGGRYRSSYPSFWEILGIEMRMRQTADASEAERLKAMRDRLVVEAADEIERLAPDVILSAGRGSKWSARVVRGNPRMAEVLAGYRAIFQDGWTTVLVRADTPAAGRHD